MKEGNSPVSEDSRTRSNGLELRKQERRVGSREQFFTLASAVPDESTAGRRNCSPSPGSRAHCPHTCTRGTRCIRDCSNQPKPPNLCSSELCISMDTDTRAEGSHRLHGPTGLLTNTEWRLPLTQHHFCEQRSDTVLLHSCISLHWDVSGHRAPLQRLVLHILQRVNKAQITMLAKVVVWLPFIHLVLWRTKIRNIVPVKQNETLCHLSIPRIYPCPQTVKTFTPPFFQENLFVRRKDCPKIFIFCASSWPNPSFSFSGYFLILQSTWNYDGDKSQAPKQKKDSEFCRCRELLASSRSQSTENEEGLEWLRWELEVSVVAWLTDMAGGRRTQAKYSKK